jgi:hypothetical protein
VTDLDGEFERMRAEARHRLESEQELEEKLAHYEAALAPPAPPREAEATDDDEDDAADAKADAAAAAPTTATGLATKAAGDAAKVAARNVLGFSTPKLLATMVLLIFGAWILHSVLGPLVTLGVFAIVVILGYRLLRWFVGGKEAPEPTKEDED